MSTFANGVAFVDGDYVPVSEARISLLDWGLLHSDATYDVVHVRAGNFFRLYDHIDRYFAGMEMLRLSIPYDRDQLIAILKRCVAKSGLQDAYVEMITTRGLPASGSRDPRSCDNKFYAFAIPFVWITKPGTGLNLIISSKQRIPPESVDPRLKNYHWLDLVLGQYEAFDKGAETAVLVDAKGNITEGPGFNLFAVKNGLLTTPGTGVLEGITRKTVIEIATHLGYPVVLGDLSPQAARSADELFATSTAGGIMPVTSVDGLEISATTTGPVTRQLQDRYWEMHRDPLFCHAVQY